MSSLLVRVISLENSPRREAMSRQLDATGIDWQFFDACTSAPSDIPYDAVQARRHHGRELTRAELGCFASHRALWRQLEADNTSDLMLVLEDDLIIDPNFFRSMETVAEAARPYEYLRLYGKLPSLIRHEALFLDRHVCRFEWKAFGTQGYFINRDGVRQFLGSIQSVLRPVDDEMDRYWVHGVPNRAIFPFPIMETDLGSTIEPSRQVSKTELSPEDQRAFNWNTRIEQVRRRWGRLSAHLRGRSA